ncbi:hypothetical protein [Actinophytocola sp.]|uniref:hypothetical protein n=1 Tax=Actinophytocola sp. TaxID=1872138 RepID=UPI003D6ADBC1
MSPEGAVWPCVFSRWLPVGNVREQSLGGDRCGRPVSRRPRRAGRTLSARARRRM